MSTNTKGHRANAPGLRGHSCGDLYPLTIVGTNFGRSWYVQHAITGARSASRRSQRQTEVFAATWKRAGCNSYAMIPILSLQTMNGA